MDDICTDTDSLLTRIQQLETENNDLRKYVEELCTQQAGPRYLHVAKGMHFQKTAGLEQEVVKLRKDLTECRRDNKTLKEELSEAFQIKMKLEDLHRAEVEKKMEAENQLKFFQEGIAAAIADRDKAFLEATIAKRRENLLSKTLRDCHRRLEEMKSDVMKAQEHVTGLQIDLVEKERLNILFMKVVDKFDQIGQKSVIDWEDVESSYIDNFSNHLHDPEETWSFIIHREAATTHNNMNTLQEERESLKKMVDNLQSKVQMGFDTESDLKRKVYDLQKKMKMSDEFVDYEISRLRQYCSEQRNVIANLLSEGNSHLMSLVHELVQNFQSECLLGEGLPSLQQNVRMPDESEREDLHTRINSVISHEVSTLMRLQELEEGHQQERKNNAILMGKMNEFQRSFEQVTAEKLEALMKLENLERKLLKGKTSHLIDGRLTKLPTNERGKATASIMKDGRFANILRRASFKRLIGLEDFDGSDSSPRSVGGGRFSSARRSSNNMDVSSMKIEISTLNESLRSLEDLTSGIHKLRVSLVKALEACMTSNDSATDNIVRSIEDIINEANIVQTSLCSSIPLSWSGVRGDTASSSSHYLADERRGEGDEDSKQVKKIKSVSAAGFEMVELLLLAARTVKDKASGRRRNPDKRLKKVQ